MCREKIAQSASVIGHVQSAIPEKSRNGCVAHAKYTDARPTPARGMGRGDENRQGSGDVR